jgi:hypothetical protein
MKNLLLIFLCIIFTIPGKGQSKNTLIFSKALEKDTKMVKAGTVLTAIGGIALFTGNFMYWKAYNNDMNPPENKVKTSRSIMLGGLGVMAVGIPLWTTGKIKERHIKIEARLIKFKGYASANGVGLALKF